jgi:hypothetical protein
VNSDDSNSGLIVIRVGAKLAQCFLQISRPALTNKREMDSGLRVLRTVLSP